MSEKDDAFKEIAKRLEGVNQPGQVSVSVTVEAGMVKVQMSQNVDFLSLTPDQADMLATTMLHFSKQARKGKT